MCAGPPGPYAWTMKPPRALRWLAWFMYASVLVAGLIGASGPARLAGFVVVILVLAAIELIDRRSLPLLAIRTLLFGAAAFLDHSGNARVLFVLLPFFVHFTLGRRAAVAAAIGCLAGVVGIAATHPGWYHDPKTISSLLMFAIGLLFAVAIAAFAATAGEHAAALATVAERTRVARDLHDNLGHELTAISIQLEKAARYRDVDADLADRAVADARVSAGRALAELRRSVHALRAEPFDLTIALQQLATRAEEHGLAVSVQVEGVADAGVDTSSLALYHVAQEGLTNVARHARAGNATLRVHYGARETRLEVADDGNGFDPAATPSGHGLVGMRERLDLVGGTLDIHSEPGRTSLSAKIPR
jgi:signal transduction histidine kinase